ncbi:TPA: glycosyltransferase family 2 protein, partial [Streptococcus agalactiae]
LRESVDSILNQTFTDFELLIINDGSTDSSMEILNSYSDSRIRIVTNEVNLRLIKTLNKGIDLATGEYIARMDCDDIADPKRLEIQLQYMEKHPDVAVCGTGVKVIGQNRKP